MKIFDTFVIFIYTIIFIIIGALLVAMSLRILSLADVSTVIEYLYTNQNFHLVVGIAGIFMIVISISIAHLMLVKTQQKRTIAFDNPDGRISISLSAIEDFIKRLTRLTPEVKELKPTVTAGKKGVEILNKVILWSDTNIPEATEKLQAMIKSRIQAILGIEETIKVLVHVVKIVHKAEITKKGEKELEPEVPFRGYGEE